VYGPKGRLRRKFLVSIKAVLDDLLALVEELRDSFPLHPDERFGGISRLPAHLHLLYYQASSQNYHLSITALTCAADYYSGD
jgi:proline utilization trans-activator